MEKKQSICKNPWCKAIFYYTDGDMIYPDNENLRDSKINLVLDESMKMPPKECSKCKSFNNDLSGGVEWKEKKYEGSRLDGMPHQISIKVNKYY